VRFDLKIRFADNPQICEYSEGAIQRRGAVVGTWGPGLFDNDAAADFLVALENMASEARVAAVRQILQDVSAASGYLDYDDAAEAVAAAAAVAFSRGVFPGLDSEVPEVLTDEPLKLSDDLSPLAVAALDRVMGGDSGWRGLWTDGEDSDDRNEALIMITHLRSLLAGRDNTATLGDGDSGRPSASAKRKRRTPRLAFEPGTILRVAIDHEWHTYARMLASKPMIAFYDCRVRGPITDLVTIVRSPVLFVLAVYDSVYAKGAWPRIGHIPLEQIDTPIPNQFMQDIGTDRCTIIDPYFNERPAEPEQCFDLERVAVWGADDIEERLRDHYAGRPNAHLAYMKVRL